MLRLVLATGVASVVTQLLLIREYVAQFQGNEFIIALILCLWLMLGAAGSLIPAAFRRLDGGAAANLLAVVSLVMAGLSPVTLIAIRMLRDAWFIGGVSVGFYAVTGFAAATLAPYAIGIGFLLPCSLGVIRGYGSRMPGARIYMADAVGDALGGAFFAFCLVFWLSPVQAAVVSGLPLAAAAWLVLPAGRRWRFGPVAALVAAVGAVAGAMTLASDSLALPFGGPVQTVESRYGRVQVQRAHGQTAIFLDGRPVMLSHDPAAAETAVHLAMCQRDRAARVMVVGAVAGMMAEIAKYRPASVDYLELDPVVTRLQFDSGAIAPIDGLSPVNMDARRFLRRFDRRYSAILVNPPSPDTFQVNRLYTQEFMALAQKRLTADGVLSIRLPGYANYIPAPLGRMAASLRTTARGVFAHVVFIPGERITMLASNAPLSTDIPRRIRAAGIDAPFLLGAYPWEASPDRLAQLASAAGAAAPANTDTAPFLMGLAFRQWFLRHGSDPVWLFVGLGILCTGYLLLAPSLESVLFTTGFTAMGMEMLIVFAFQVFYGYVYFQIGAIITAFLAGLIPGAWLGQQLASGRRRALLLSDMLLIMLAATAMPALWLGGSGIPPAGYLAYGFIAAAVCGFQFPLILNCMGDDARAAGRAFAADLAGAGAGTLVTATVLLPFTGLYGVAGGLIAVKTISLLRVSLNR